MVSGTNYPIRKVYKDVHCSTLILCMYLSWPSKRSTVQRIHTILILTWESVIYVRRVGVDTGHTGSCYVIHYTLYLRVVQGVHMTASISQLTPDKEKTIQNCLIHIHTTENSVSTHTGSQTHTRGNSLAMVKPDTEFIAYTHLPSTLA